MLINTVRIHISCTLYALLMGLLYLTKDKNQVSEAIKKRIAHQVKMAYRKDKLDETSEGLDLTIMMMVMLAHQD